MIAYEYGACRLYHGPTENYFGPEVDISHKSAFLDREGTVASKRTASKASAGIHEVKTASGEALSCQMECFGPGHHVGQEVSGSVHDNQHSKILRSHPQNALEETRQRGQHDRVPDGHQ